MAKYLKIKDNAKESKLFYHRSIAMMIIIVAMIMVLILRLGFLQVHQHERYTTLSDANELSVIPIEPTRGLIYDRNGVLLAENIPVFSLDIIPAKVTHLKQTIEALGQIVTISPQNLKDFYKLLPQTRKHEPVPLKIGLNEEEVARFSLDQWKYPGVEINARLMRYYPQGPATAHVIGYMGRINEQELTKLDDANYSATNMIGKTGIEKYFENELHGTVGYQQVENDVSGRVVRVLKKTPPVAGATLYLTLDSKLQLAAAQAMGNNHGAVVAIKPDTGEVLAMVSDPSFDPNMFIRGISSKDYNSLQQSIDKPLYNRAVRGLYPSGSTIKPFYALEGLHSGVVTPQYHITDPGFFVFGNHTYRDWKKGGHGVVDLHKAIMMSCDVYFYNLALKHGIQRIDDVLNAFGFGQLTRVENLEELPGVAPSPQWKKTHLHDKWYTGDTISLGVGQGYLLVTPIQLAAAVSTISQSGKRFQPHLLLKLERPDGTGYTQKPIALPPVDITPESFAFVQNAMQDVIRSPGGTAYGRFGHDTPYTVAAKTGTAQVFSANGRDIHNQEALPYELRDNTLFITFAPVDKPQIALAVLAEHTHDAAIIARKIMDAYLLNKPVTPDITPDASNPGIQSGVQNDATDKKTRN